MSADHVRVTGIGLVALFLYQLATFRRHGRHAGSWPSSWAARVFLVEAFLLYGSWPVAGVLLLFRRTEMFHETGIVFGKAPAPRGLGLALFLLVNLLLVWTRRHLGRNLRLAGAPPFVDGSLVTTGPYAIVRHPLYVAALLLGPALVLIVGSWLFLVPTAAIVVTLPFVIAHEERLLVAGYGGAYRAYARRTRRLLPWVWGVAAAAAVWALAPRAVAETASPSPAPAAARDAAGFGLDEAALAELARIAETRGFTRGLPAKPTPSPDGRRVFFLESGPADRYQRLFVFDVASGTARVFLEPDSLGAAGAISKEEQARRERQRQTERGITTFAVSDDGARLLVPYSGDLFLVDAASGAPRRLTRTRAPEIDPHLSPDGTRVAFVRDGDLVVLDIANGEETILAGSADPDIEYGTAEFVAQEEMGRMTGHWWAPDSRRIALTEVDTRDVPRFRVPDFSDPAGEGSVSPYPKAGDPNAKVRLGVADLSRPGDVRWLDLGEDVEYLARVHWAPDGRALWVETQPRSQKRLDLSRIDLATGGGRRVLSEGDRDWVNLHDDFRLLDGDERFLWSSERTGHRHLEVVRADGRRERVLTEGPWDVTAVLDVDERRGQVTFAATKDGVTERHLYRVPLAGGPVRRLTREPGWHGAAFHEKGHDVWVSSFEDDATPPRFVVRRRDGKAIGALPSAAEAPPADLLAPAAEILRVETPEGVPLDIQLVAPPEGAFPGRRPLIVYAYGGPHGGEVRRRWGGERGLYDAWLARRGFFVARIDGRGVAARGHGSERIFAGRLGDEEVADQAAGVRALCARKPRIDPERVGIWGWSYGGYLTLMALLRAPEVFRAGVAVAPVVDWRGYDTHYTERYLGFPTENAAGYDSSSVLSFVPALSGSLTLVHGTGDDNVHFRESMLLARALVDAGKRFDLMVYPGTHMMESVAERVHLYSLVVQGFAGAFRR